MCVRFIFVVYLLMRKIGDIVKLRRIDFRIFKVLRGFGDRFIC